MSTQVAPPKTDRRIIKTKASIERAFITLLKEKDLSKITISAIAMEADINRKTFYLHYSSVDELFDAMVSDRVTSVIQDLLNHHRSNPEASPLADIAADLCLTLHHDAQTCPEVYGHVPLIHVFNLALEPLKNAILHERAQNNLPEIENLELYLRFAFAGAFSVYHKWLTQDSDMPIDEIADIIRNATAHGIGDML